MAPFNFDISRGKPGLACLALAAIEDDSTLLDSLADWLGYEPKEGNFDFSQKQPSPVNKTGTSIGKAAKTEIPPPKTEPRSYLPYPFWRVSKVIESITEEDSTGRPEWLKPDYQPPVLQDTPKHDAHCRLPWPEQLVTMNRVWPMLINDLASPHKTSQPDISRIIRRMADGRSLPKVLRLERQKWSDDIHVIVDTASHLFPYRSDCMRLAESLYKRVGSARMQILRFLDFPGGRCEGWYLDDSPADEYSPPNRQGRVLILGDLGVLSNSSSLVDDWIEFVQNLNRSGIQVYQFTPADAGKWSSAIKNILKVQPWNPRARFPRHIGTYSRDRFHGSTPAQLEQLKVFLSCTSLFDPGLLREFRTQFIPEAPPELEAFIWKQTDDFVFQGALGTWQPDRLGSYRKQFRKIEHNLQERALQIRDDCFSHFPSDFQAVQGILKEDVSNVNADESRNYLQAMLREEFVPDRKSSGSNRSFFRFFLDNQDSYAWYQDGDLLHTAFAVVHEEDLKQGNLPDQLPEGFDPDKIKAFVVQPVQGFVSLYQKNDSLICKYHSSATSPAISVAEICTGYKTTGPPVWKTAGRPWHPVNERVELNKHQQPLTIHTGTQSVECTAFHRPDWASSIGRDDRGLFVGVPWLGLTHVLYWQNPTAETEGKWEGDGSVGMDQYGLYGDLDVQGVVQRFRWLEPGTFMMGSPGNEPERDEDEVLHEVALGQGFWLADTTVTQDLWQAVMGDNPSSFKGGDRPVENVSWEDVQQFTDKMNGLISQPGVRLPWEAEWEYGCRAGTTTPFSFGDNISPEQVNYDGNSPYGDGEKGEYREQSVVVKSLPCNDWGLYEMHGNVWEWCGDRYQEDLGSESVLDPHGPEKGEYRVMRGGSWFNYGRYVRSAIRDRNDPSYRYHFIGFRLARGHELKQSR